MTFYAGHGCRHGVGSHGFILFPLTLLFGYRQGRLNFKILQDAGLWDG